MKPSIPVFLEQCASYSDTHVVQAFLARVFEKRYSSLRNQKILIKPNLVSFRNRGLAATNGQFLLALIDFLVAGGARVHIGDSPAFGSARWVLRGIGLGTELRRRNIPIIEFQKVAVKTTPAGLKVGVSAEIYDYELLVNVPKVKAHCQMHVTLAVKNIFGVVKGMRKSFFHMQLGDRPGVFPGLLLDLLALIPDTFTVVDGIVAMHKDGPVRGEPLNLGLLAAGEDAVAVDRALLEVLALDPVASPVYAEAKRRQFAGMDLESVTFPLRTPDVFHGSGFFPPAELQSVRFNPFRFFQSSIKRFGLQLTRR